MPDRFVPRAGGGGSRQSAFGKAYQSCSPIPFGPLECSLQAGLRPPASNPKLDAGVPVTGWIGRGGGREGPATGVGNSGGGPQPTAAAGVERYASAHCDTAASTGSNARPRAVN